MKQGVCILGSTGSIGCNALDVIARNIENYQVEVLTANNNVERLFEQCTQFDPQIAILRDQDSAAELSRRLASENVRTIVHGGEEAVASAACTSGVTTVVAAIVGAAGLIPTLTAVECGHKVLLANKEALVMSGDIFTQAVAENDAILLPVDSEHNAIFQCLPNSMQSSRPDLNGVDKILLTGSGGPFRTFPIQQLSQVTPEQACAHPNWDMGKKISVDSATMMNKGLELIEAGYLFGVGLSQIDIVVHPQSIVHSMVSYDDGSVLAQMGNPDMRTPIAHTLAWPERIDAGVKPLDFYQMKDLSFSEPDYERFPCLKLAQRAMLQGGAAPCILNAANEVAVAAFLAGEIRFTDIAVIIERTLDNMTSQQVETIDQVIEVDRLAREIASGIATAGGST